MSAPSDLPPTHGLVLRLRHRGAVLELHGRVVDAALAGKLLQGRIEFTSRIAVGDRVRVEERGKELVIVEVLPRHSALSRERQLNGREQVMVANVDRALFALSLAEPAFRARLVDRLLVAAARGGFAPVLLFTKCDLVPDRTPFEDFAELYRGLGVPVIFVSTVTGEGIAEVRASLCGAISVLAAQSGVWKSTLLNQIVPGLGLAVAEISKKWGKGQHTTTSSSLHALPDGGYLADTPGIRSFALPRLEANEAARYFPEFVQVASGCRYSSCTHRHEPSCAVKSAVEVATIQPCRYESYLRIVAGVEEE